MLDIFFGALNDHVGHPAYRFEPSGCNDMLTADTLHAAHLARLEFFLMFKSQSGAPRSEGSLEVQVVASGYVCEWQRY